MDFEDFDDEECTSLDLSSQGISSIPETLLQNTDIFDLNLNFNDIIVIPPSICDRLKCLSRLYLNGNSISSLPDNIGALTCLTELHVKENALSILPESLGELFNLRVLHAVGNNLTSLPDSIVNLKNLKELLISENCILSLPEQIQNLENLEILDASDNKICHLPILFGNLKNLRCLNLSSNELKSLPVSLENLQCLESFDISDNKIIALPDTFSSSFCLKRLYADNNDIGIIPEWFADMQSITEISLKGNGLCDSPFPEHFGLMSKSLEHLNLSGNYIKLLPKCFPQLHNLRFLDLGSMLDELERRRNLSNGNFLTELPPKFGELKNLRELHLDENQVEKLPDGFGHLVSLEFLDLSHNGLSELPESFCCLRSLTVCMLSMNYLKKLPLNFGCLKQLVDLRLDNNQLATLPDSFANLTELETLDLYQNNLTKIPLCTKKMKKLKRLDITENNFGVPQSEVPEIAVPVKYPSRDPNLKDNWRGRERKDLFRVTNLATNEATGADHDTLSAALLAGSSIRKRHADETVPNDVENSDEKQLVKEESSSTMETWDEDLQTLNSKEVLTRVENGSSSSKSDSIPGKESTQLCCENLSPVKSSVDAFEEDWESEVIFESERKYNGTYRHPVEVKRNTVPPSHFFLPSDIHVPPICRDIIWFCAEDGQFDDADDL